MTRKEFYEKYGDVKVKFKSYYKYTFTYTAQLPNGNQLICTYGDNAGDIYRHNVTADGEVSINTLYPYAGYVHDENGNELEEFYGYS